MFADVWSGLRRNVTMTIAMILTTAISLCLMGAGLLVKRTVDKMQEQVGSKVEVTIYLTTAQSQQDPNCQGIVCQNLGDALRNDDDIESESYINRDATWKNYQEMFADQPEMLSIAKPSDLNTSWHVKMKDPHRFGVVKLRYQDYPGVEMVKDRAQALDQLFSTLRGIRNATLLVALIQAIAAFLLISNTVQMAAYTRRTETTIMRLVGASRWRTQLPFMLEAIVSAVAGAVIALGGLVVAKYILIDKVLGGISFLPSVTVQDFIWVSPWVGGLAVALGAVSSYVTLRLYVRL